MYWYADPGFLRRNSLTFGNGAREVGPGLLDGQLLLKDTGYKKRCHVRWITFDPFESSTFGRQDAIWQDRIFSISEGFQSSFSIPSCPRFGVLTKYSCWLCRFYIIVTE